VLKVCLFRPWSTKHFLDSLPKTVKHVTVLDKTREDGGVGNPLYLDSFTTIKTARPDVHVYQGIYGIASKPFTPEMIVAIFNNMKKDKPMLRFNIGIVDDVTHTSLDYEPLEKSTMQKNAI
jgi:pyruvate-ferredoxin/flavodoxin oxidoreductase